MLTLKACSSGWMSARDAYDGLSCRCTPVTSANYGASCGFEIFRRAARMWPDQSIQARLLAFVGTNQAEFNQLRCYPYPAECILPFQHSVKSHQTKNDSAESKWSPVAVYSCSRNTCP